MADPAATSSGRRLAALAQARVAAFRRQRPLRAGSLIVTIFGDAVMPRGGAIALGSLIRLAQAFGLNERLVRTTAARLAQEGWLESCRAGKRSEYRLSAGGRLRFAEATLRIYGPTPPWSGRWTLLALPPLAAAERQELRRELTYQGFGEISPGLFAHPQMSRPEVDRALAAFPSAASSLVFEASLHDGADPRALVSRGWNLVELARGYQRFAERYAPALVTARSSMVEPLTGFVLRTLLIHDYRRLHLRDPLLPARLLPADWPGFRAAELCAALYGAVFTASEAHLSATAERLAGALPATDPVVLERFGGIPSGP